MSTMMIFRVGSELSGEAQISYIRGLQSRVDLASVQGSSPLYTGWAKKVDHRLMTIILSNLNRFNFFFAERFLGKFAAKWILQIPPHLAYVATLPCETLMSAKQAINDNL